MTVAIVYQVALRIAPGQKRAARRPGRQPVYAGWAVPTPRPPPLSKAMRNRGMLPDQDKVAKDLGVLNIASALPFSIAPAIAPAILAIGTGYGALYAVAGVCAVIGAFAILRVRGVR